MKRDKINLKVKGRYEFKHLTKDEMKEMECAPKSSIYMAFDRVLESIKKYRDEERKEDAMVLDRRNEQTNAIIKAATK